MVLNFKKNSAPDENNNGGNGGGNGGNGTPPTGQVFMVDILDIQTSRLNPRQTQGDNYQSTKESIKSVGLLQMLTVTKQPDAEKYELYSGGNTRLTILKELYDEYMAEDNTDKANEIRYQQCLYVPYTNDLDVLVKHMAENEERSNMTFIDKARAVFQIKDIYLRQENVENISNNKLVKYIHSLGWTSVNQPSMTELTFAFDKLDNAIPLALNQGMGKGKVEQLRKWLNYATIYVKWLVEKHSYDYSVEQAERLYFEVLSSYDDDIEPINLEEFFQEYLFQLSNILMTFDEMLKMEVVQFELEQVEELGYVPEVQPKEELSQQLKETATVPPFEFPEPRKPRTTKPKDDDLGTDNGFDTGAEDNFNHTTGADTDNVVTDSIVDAVAAKTIPETGAGNLFAETVTGATDGITDMEKIAEIGKQQTIAIFEKIIPSYDMKRELKEIVHYGDNDDSLHIYPPYFSLDISSEEKRILLTQKILSAEWPLQYLILHLMNVYMAYYENDFDHNSFTADEKETFKNLIRVWREYSTKYGHYTGLCETGLISRNILQNDSVMEVHQLIKEHLHNIRAFEVLHAGNNGEL